MSSGKSTFEFNQIKEQIDPSPLAVGSIYIALIFRGSFNELANFESTKNLALQTKFK